ncbi:hypothetical protein QZH52_30145 [Variovorax ginsengisoli]|uniref:Uncharacterized protein n=1 Tax=Variovorax ginsengisoli TaxID=363844 RepID=A0ABT8SDS2_9BURK|nr:hypothetical protein [Variovorax ginsengisoli]MDN8617383.1 hypothetical protein [Variovorax ginsengisoli]MDO1536553.1 hypothetical protein [Variovorax ginsengisoli]
MSIVEANGRSQCGRQFAFERRRALSLCAIGAVPRPVGKCSSMTSGMSGSDLLNSIVVGTTWLRARSKGTKAALWACTKSVLPLHPVTTTGRP